MTDNAHSIKLSIGNLELSVSGSREFVEGQFFKLYENHGIEKISLSVNDITSNGDSNERSGQNNSSGRKQNGSLAGGLDKTLNEYLADSEVSTYQDNALVVGWYLENAEGQNDFTATEVEDKALKDKVELGTKVRRDLNKNVQKGYLHSPSKRDGNDTYWVTESGEDYLEDCGFPIP